MDCFVPRNDSFFVIARSEATLQSMRAALQSMDGFVPRHDVSLVIARSEATRQSML